jgi:hypothetical protein
MLVPRREPIAPELGRRPRGEPGLVEVIELGLDVERGTRTNVPHADR